MFLSGLVGISPVPEENPGRLKLYCLTSLYQRSDTSFPAHKQDKLKSQSHHGGQRGRSGVTLINSNGGGGITGVSSKQAVYSRYTCTQTLHRGDVS